MPRDSERSLDKVYETLRAFYAERYTLLQEMETALDFSQIDATLVHDRHLDAKVSRPIMIIGEAPGANEVEQQTPFVGMAGKNLSSLIEGAGFSREKDFLITNAFPFRTFQEGANGIKNRTPSTAELKAGSILLKMELEIVQPRMILVLGGSAKKAVLRLEDRALTSVLKMMENHTFEKVGTDMGFSTILGLSFHPSPLVFNMRQKRDNLIKFFHELKNHQL